jgi:hypothetical protein
MAKSRGALTLLLSLCLRLCFPCPFAPPRCLLGGFFLPTGAGAANLQVSSPPSQQLSFAPSPSVVSFGVALLRWGSAWDALEAPPADPWASGFVTPPRLSTHALQLPGAWWALPALLEHSPRGKLCPFFVAVRLDFAEERVEAC